MDKETRKQYAFVWYLLGAILVIDQIVKIWVKTQKQIGEDIPLIGDWCRLHFVENEGFAFGMKLGGSAGKIILQPKEEIKELTGHSPDGADSAVLTFAVQIHKATTGRRRVLTANTEYSF